MPVNHSWSLSGTAREPLPGRGCNRRTRSAFRLPGPARCGSRASEKGGLPVGDQDEGSEHLTVVPVLTTHAARDSASKLKASPEARDESHRPDSIQDEDVEQDADPGSRDYPHGADATPACF